MRNSVIWNIKESRTGCNNSKSELEFQEFSCRFHPLFLEIVTARWRTNSISRGLSYFSFSETFSFEYVAILVAIKKFIIARE